MQADDIPTRVVGTYGVRALGWAAMFLAIPAFLLFKLTISGTPLEQGRLAWMPRDLFLIAATAAVLVLGATGLEIVWFAWRRTEVLVLDDAGVMRRFFGWRISAGWDEIVAFRGFNKPVRFGQPSVYISCRPPAPGHLKTIPLSWFLSLDRAAAVRLIAGRRPDLADQARRAFCVRDERGAGAAGQEPAGRAGTGVAG